MRSRIALVAHSGGPTPVINASLLGALKEARCHPEITGFYGARFGLSGVLKQDFIDLYQQPETLMQRVARAPASALGTSRQEVSLQDLRRVIDVFRSHDVRYFFYTGGNGSMGTAHQLEGIANELKYDLRIIGIPKTIDNDLMHTDHTPGYGSAARFFATAARDIGADNRSLPNQAEFIEVLGRNAGWLAAATSLARRSADDSPHLIYFPERRLPLDQLLDDVSTVYRRLGRCVVAVCEGQLNECGEPFGADTRPGSGSSLAMNLAHRLAMLVSQRLRLRARSEKPGLLGRAHQSSVSERDWAESRLCGQRAVQAAVEGESGKMITLAHTGKADDTAQTGLVELQQVAFMERLFPSEWIHSAGNDVMPEFRAYAAPLVGSIEPHESLLDLAVDKQPITSN